MVFVDRRSVYWRKKSAGEEAKELLDLHAHIFLVLMPAHFARLTYKLIAVKAEKRMTAFSPIFLRSSCSGSAAQWRKVTTSLAIWEVVAGVPGGGRKQLFVRMSRDIQDTILTVFVLDHSVKKDTRHRDSATGEEWVIVHSIADFDAGGRVDIASEKGEDIILRWSQSAV